MSDPSAADSALQRISLVANEWPALKETATLYEAMLPVMAGVGLSATGAGLIHMTAEEARDKMTKGLPLLCGADLEIDSDAVRDLMIQLAIVAEEVNAGPVTPIRQALEEGFLDMDELIPQIVAGEEEAITGAAMDLQLDPGLVLMLAGAAIKPALREWGRQVTPLAKDISWEEGYCFVCGSNALLAELRGDNHMKHLRCGQCGADWSVRRLQCMQCGNDDHRTLGYLYPEDKPGNIQIETCDRCRGYLKVITSFEPTPCGMLEVEDLATRYLDYIAMDRGYARRCEFSE